jgi:hypothetical protein
MRIDVYRYGGISWSSSSTRSPKGPEAIFGLFYAGMCTTMSGLDAI